jgi:hypothetical protein
VVLVIARPTPEILSGVKFNVDCPQAVAPSKQATASVHRMRRTELILLTLLLTAASKLFRFFSYQSQPLRLASCMPSAPNSKIGSSKPSGFHLPGLYFRHSMKTNYRYQWMKSLWAGLMLLVASPAWAQADSSVRSPALSGKFQIVDKTIDLGRHDQGEMVTGSIKFKGPRVQIEVMRASGFAGLQVRGIDWEDDTAGAIRFAIDTSLLTESISKTVVFQPVNSLRGFPDPVTADSATMSIQIKGKVRILQLPQSEVAKREGMVELEIHNIGDTRFKVESVTVPGGERFITFMGEDNRLPMLAPGESAVLPLFFTDLSGPRDPELVFRFTSGVFARNTLYFRLDLSNSQLRILDIHR